jgi:uncharacterized protein YcgI (DUF1989 family)
MGGRTLGITSTGAAETTGERAGIARQRRDRGVSEETMEQAGRAGRGRVVVPPQSGRVVRVARGSVIRISDPRGQQVADTWAIARDGRQWLSTSQTRAHTARLFPVPGQRFLTNAARPILTLVEDGSPGPHDMLYPPCDAEEYAAAGYPDHPSCRQNFVDALAAAGMQLPVVPDPLNLFQNSPPRHDGSLDVLASRNPPGGYVVLRAELDLLLIVTACSVDTYPTNGWVCTEIHIDIAPH